MKQVPQITAVAMQPVQLTFQIKDDRGGFPDWVVIKFGIKKLRKRYGPHLTIRCPNCFMGDGNPNPSFVHINTERWGGIPDKETLQAEAAWLQKTFQAIMQAWYDDCKASNDREIATAKAMKFARLPAIPKNHPRSKSAEGVKDLLRHTQESYRKRMDDGKPQEAYIVTIDYDYHESVLRALLSKRFNGTKFVRLVSNGDTAAREVLPESVWNIVGQFDT